MSDFVVSTAQLADVFQLSERRIQQLCAAGVIDALPGSRAKRFDLETVVGQYAGFLILRALDDSVTVDSWAEMSLEQLELWLDDLDAHDE